MALKLGRCGRLEYFFSLIILGGIMLSVEKNSDFSYGQPNQGLVFFLLILFILNIIQCLRRLNDIGKSGWYILLLLVPFANLYIGIQMLLQKGNNLKKNVEEEINVSQNFPSEDVILSDNTLGNSKTERINQRLFQENIYNMEETKKNLFQLGINFLTFDTPTFRSVFDEGQRRLMIVVSIIAPILISYIWFYDFEDGYLPSDWPVASPIFYIILHVIILVYIWIREGSGNVRPGGNAGKSLWNMVKVGVITFVIFAAVAISFKEYERVQKQKRIEEEKAVVLEKTERFVSCIPTENIDCITDFFVYHKKNEIRTGYLQSFSDCDFNNASLKNASVQRKWNNQWNYELNGKIEYNIRCSKNKKYKLVENNITVTYNTNLDIIDIKIGD